MRRTRRCPRWWLRTFRAVSGLLLALDLGLAPAAVAGTAAPNILLVYVDDLGYGDTAIYGHPVVRTPHIDRLAHEGARFTQFYAPSALCSPSRAGLLTGRHPYRTGVRDWIPDGSAIALGHNEQTLADLARQRGYRTAVIGKWHLNGGLGMRDAPQPRDFGFDFQYGLDAWVKNAAVAGGDVRPRRGHMYPDNIYRQNVAVGPTDKYSAELVSDEALAWLAADKAPFFLYLTYSEVHTPVASPERWLRAYERFRSAEAKANPLAYYFDWRDRPWRGRGDYYANISFLDEQLGRVLDQLRTDGRLDNTLVIFSSDNGPVRAEASTPWELGMAGETDGLRGAKRYLFEGGLRVPGIVRFPPLVEPGVEIDEPVTALDVFPTIAAVLDAQPVQDTPRDGMSLLPLLEGEAWLRSGTLLWSIAAPDGSAHALRDGDWKLIADAELAPRYLFNLSEDRYEVDNRLEGEPEVAERLLSLLRERVSEIAADPLLRARGVPYQASP